MAVDKAKQADDISGGLRFPRSFTARAWGTRTTRHEAPSKMRNLLSCTFGKVCHDLPGACIVLQMILVVALASVLGYVFVTQELMG